MKPKILFLALLLALATHGSSCINQGFIVPVNLTVHGCYAVPSGSTVPLVFDQTMPYALSALIDATFRENIRDARFYDIQISTEGTFAGNVVGIIYVNGQPLLNIGGGESATAPVSWSVFREPQSLLAASPYLHTSPSGAAALASALKAFANSPDVSITLRALGQVSGSSPVPEGLSVCVKILAQADAALND
jgi:hypothetical protein